MKMFKALLPYFGGKRRLCPAIFKQISEYLPRDKWYSSTFVDGFLGSGAVSLFAKAQGFRIIANDIAERSYITGKALIENNREKIDNWDTDRLFVSHPDNKHFIEKNFVPDVFTGRHAEFLDKAFLNATSHLLKYLLMKYVFYVRPYSKFSSPNAFNRPMEEGRFDEIKKTYTKNIKNNFTPIPTILTIQKDNINAGIFTNNKKNQILKEDVFSFVDKVSGEILYLDPPYANTLAYENEYKVLDTILGDEIPKSIFSGKDGIYALDTLLEKAEKFPLWVISFGNAAGKNELNKLIDIVSAYRRCKVKEFAYRHCEAMASEEHKAKCKEWVVIGYTGD